MPVLLGIAFIFVLIAVVNLIQRLLQKQATKAAAAFADSIGFSFEISQSPPIPPIPGNYLLFALGRPHQRRNVMEGTYKGMRLTIYEYVFVRAMDRFDESFQQTVIQLTSTAAPLPLFALCPHLQLNAMMVNMPTQAERDLLLETAGIRLPDHPDFRDTYKLIGSEPQQIQSMFDNENVFNAVAVLEEKPYQGRVCLEGYGDTLLFYPLYTRIPLKELQHFMDKCINCALQIAAVAKE